MSRRQPTDDEIERHPFFQHARNSTFPMIEGAYNALMILDGGKPHPKFCLELGAAIMFDKPILLLVLPGVEIPLGLRTIANKIVEVADNDPKSPETQRRLTAPLREMFEASKWRTTPKEGGPDATTGK